MEFFKRQCAILGAIARADLGFYRRLYPDLASLSRLRLLLHFVLHGHREGRFINPRQAQIELEQRFGRLPSDFDPTIYFMRNRDLDRVYARPDHAIFHFLSHGRAEGRPYKGAVAGQSLWELFFVPAEFVASGRYHSPLPPASREEALAAFRATGVESLAPISFAFWFDPEFYRSSYTMSDTRSDVQLYVHWLRHGIKAGEVPNEEAFLERYLDRQAFPIQFDWQRFRQDRKLRTKNGVASRAETVVIALESENLTDRDVKALGSAIGRLAFRQNRFDVARRSFERVHGNGCLGARDVHKLGEIYAAQGRLRDAASVFEDALLRSDASIWSLVKLSEVSSSLGDFDRAFGYLHTCRNSFVGMRPYHYAVAKTIDALYDDAVDKARSLYRLDRRYEADRLVTKALDRVLAEIRLLEQPGTVSLSANPHGPIIIVGEMSLPQCRHYRIDQKVEQLRRLGKHVGVHDHRDLAAARNALLGAASLIVYRLAADPDTLRLLNDASRLGLPIFYDIDDLVFDTSFPEPLEAYGGMIDRETHIALMASVPLHRYAISLCDQGIASTEILAERLKPLVRSRDCHVWPNALAGEQGAPRPFLDRGSACVDIVYGSATKAHKADFTFLVADALETLLARYAWLRLIVVGEFHLGARFRRFGSQFVEHGLMPFSQYEAILQSADLTFSVLGTGAEADAKSEIKWLEAAAFRVPCIVSPTAPFRAALISGQNTFFAETPAEWLTTLERLILDPELRQSIGQNAFDTASARFSSSIVGAHAFGIMSKAISANERPRGDSLRVLICHVFFAPNRLGGATRVVVDTVDYIKAEAKDIELCVFTTEPSAAAADQVGYDSYDGTPIVRVSVDGPRQDEDPTSSDTVRTAFAKLLDTWQPDCVHFHCLQTLGATIVSDAAERGVPYVITLHDGWWSSPHQFFMDADGFLAVPAAGDNERLNGFLPLLNNATRLLAVSESFSQLHRELGLANIETLANGVAVPIELPRTIRVADRVTVGHFGGRNTQKGATLLEGVVRANRFENLAFLIVDAALEPGERTEAVWGVTPVTLIGPIAQDQIHRLYAEIDVLAAPSVWPESFGLVTREALALGIWTIVSDRGAIADDVRHDVNGYVIDVSDGTGLVDALMRVDRDHQRFQTRGALPSHPLRTARDHGRDTVEIYRSISRDQRAGRIDAPNGRSLGYRGARHLGL